MTRHPGTTLRPVRDTLACAALLLLAAALAACSDADGGNGPQPP